MSKFKPGIRVHKFFSLEFRHKYDFQSRLKHIYHLGIIYSVWTVLRCRMPLNTYVSSTWFKAETLTKKIRRKYVFSFLEICNITLWFNVICTDLTMRYDVFDYLESTVDDCVMQRGTTVDICP